MRHSIENKGTSPIYVGGKMIAPGEIQTFEEEDLPPEHRPAAEGEAIAEPADPLALILALSIAKATLGLPDLSDEELKQLEAMEEAGAARKGMLAEIAMEILRRADLKATGGEPPPPPEGEAASTDGKPPVNEENGQ